MEENQKTIEENNNISDYQLVNQLSKNSYLKEKGSKLYNGLCKATVPLVTMGLIGANYSKALGYVSNLQYNLLQKSLENPSVLNKIISYPLNSQYLDDILVAGGAAIAFITACNIAEKYNPIGKGLNFVGKSTYSSVKYIIDGLRDFVGEGIIAALASKQKWGKKLLKLRKKVSTKETYESNVMRDNEIFRRKINKIQKLKIKYQDMIVEDTQLNQQKIEKANNKIQKLEERLVQA